MTTAFLLGTFGLARGAPMVTDLATIRAEAKTSVGGTLRSDKSGLSIEVEYAIRGNAAKGPMTVNDSPDGHVFVDLDPNKNRVVSFVDDKKRLRWVGRLLAGPSLEKGVIQLAGPGISISVTFVMVTSPIFQR